MLECMLLVPCYFCWSFVFFGLIGMVVGLGRGPRGGLGGLCWDADWGGVGGAVGVGQVRGMRGCGGAGVWGGIIICPF